MEGKKVSEFKVLTFDCYGTLIDWETGIYQSISHLLTKSNIDLPELTRQKILVDYALSESEQEEETPNANYRLILKLTYQKLCKKWGIEYKEEEGEEFGDSVGKWPAFEDSAKSLQYLKKFYRLVILSNIDKASFAQSNIKLEVEFDAIYTAEEIGSYKPNLNNFHYLLEKEGEKGVKKEEILHTAQSLFHDHVPAKQLSFSTAWIDRNQNHLRKKENNDNNDINDNKAEWGATRPPPVDVTPDFIFSTLAEFVEKHQSELAL